MLPQKRLHISKTKDVQTMAALVNSDLPDLMLLSKGKVRDIYSTASPDHLLFVATDRISAYDVILKNVRIPSLDWHLWYLAPMVGNSRQRQTFDENLPFLVQKT